MEIITNYIESASQKSVLRTIFENRKVSQIEIAEKTGGKVTIISMSLGTFATFLK